MSLRARVRRAAAAQAFDRAHALSCQVCKQDLPAVRAVIELLRRPAEGQWRRLAADILDEVEDRLDELTDGRGLAEVDALEEDGAEEALLLALLGLVTDQVQGSRPGANDGRLQRATRRLFSDGAASVGLSINLDRHAALRAAAEADALTLLRGRVLSRETELRSLFRAFLTTRPPRQVAQAPVGPSRGLQPGALPRSRQEFNEQLGAVLDAESTSVAVALDQWAYRWFAVAQLQAGLDAGFRLFRYSNNPPEGPDERTTPFCDWVHERVVPLGAAMRQLRSHVRAATSGDIEALMGNWPLLSSQLARAQESEAAGEWRAHLRRNPLPPFHFQCRTVIEPLRLR